MQMPEMDGFELAQRIKQTPEIAGIRLAMLSSVVNTRTWEELEAAGIEAYLTKPVRQSELFDCLASLTARLAGELTADESAGFTPGAGDRGGLPSDARILIAEDNPVNQEVALAMLDELGLRADVAWDGQSAVQAVSEARFDVVFMDCQMPEMDGFAATRAIREVEAHGEEGVPRLPIVAVTANAVAGDRERCLAAGMDDYLSKPFTQAQLEDVLRRWLCSGQDAVGATPLGRYDATPFVKSPSSEPSPVGGDNPERVGDDSATPGSSLPERTPSGADTTVGIATPIGRVTSRSGPHAVARTRTIPPGLPPDIGPLPGSQPGIDDAPLDVVRLANIRALQREGRPDILSRIVRIFLNEAPRHLEALHQAVADNRPDELRRAAHTLKGGAANLGAKRLAGHCQTLEAIGRARALGDALEVLTAAELEFGVVEEALTQEVGQSQS